LISDIDSTTVKILTGILTPDSGDVQVDGLVPRRKRQELAEKIGVVFGQRTRLRRPLPAEESLRYTKALYSISDKTYRENVDYLTEVLGIGELLPQPVRSLSLGQRMRMELSAAMLHNPKLLYLDEPAGGFLGWLIGIPAANRVPFPPPRAPEDPGKVTILRRFTALIVDLFTWVMATLFATQLFITTGTNPTEPEVFYPALALGFLLHIAPFFIGKRSTIGMLLLRISIAPRGGPAGIFRAMSRILIMAGIPLALLPLGFFGGLAAFGLDLIWVVSVMADPARIGLPGRLSGTEIRAY